MATSAAVKVKSWVGKGRGTHLAEWRAERAAQLRQAQRDQAQHALTGYVSPRYDTAMVLADLEIDEHYQRARTEAKVNKLRAHFNPNACQPLAISKRTDGSLFLVDGQHRAAALQDLGIELWPALVYQNLSRQEEAAMWSELNTRQTKPKATERFNARLTQRDPEALAIKSVVEKIGFAVHTQRSSRPQKGSAGEITAVEALERVYRRNKAIGLTDTLTTIALSWPDKDEAARLQRLIILGIAEVLHGPGSSRLDRTRLIQVLKKSTPGTWIGRALGDTGDMSPAQCFAARVREFYNKGASRKERLPSQREV